MIGFNSFNSLFELLEAFPTEQSCIEYLKKVRWGEKVESPFSPGSKVYVCGNNTYLCKDTGRRFNVKREPFLRIRKCHCKMVYGCMDGSFKQERNIIFTVGERH